MEIYSDTKLFILSSLSASSVSEMAAKAEAAQRSQKLFRTFLVCPKNSPPAFHYKLAKLLNCAH